MVGEAGAQQSLLERYEAILSTINQLERKLRELATERDPLLALARLGNTDIRSQFKDIQGRLTAAHAELADAARTLRSVTAELCGLGPGAPIAVRSEEEAARWRLESELDTVLEAVQFNTRRLEVARAEAIQATGALRLQMARTAMARATEALDPLLARAGQITAELSQSDAPDARLTDAEKVRSCKGAAVALHLPAPDAAHVRTVH